jgi:hypothetical protein
MKTFGKLAIVGIIAVIFSTLSMRIQMGTDTSESEAIGITKNYGFPIWYQTTTPGLSWAQYDPIRFWLNTGVWVLFVGASAVGLKRVKKAGSNKAFGTYW